MRPAVLICSVLLLAGVCLADDCDCDNYNRRPGSFRVDLMRQRADNNDVEINRLFKAASKLEAKIDAMSDGPNVDELKARVDALIGNDCESSQYECADRSKCVNQLQTCDGEEDCGDGSDESEDTCKIRTPQGSSWGAAISHNECFKAAANYLRVVMTKAERSDVLSSKVSLDVTTFLYTSDGNVNVGHAEGFYYFGTKTASFRATDGDILDLNCQFNGYDDDECHGKIYRANADEPCGEIVFIRE